MPFSNIINMKGKDPKSIDPKRMAEETITVKDVN